MGEVFLDKTISQLSSEKQKARSDGLADLKHIFQQNKKSSKLQTLNDKACHKIFESLFRFVAAERSTFNRAQKSTNSSSASRLSTCASVIRMAVDFFLKNLRIKTVRAIIDHITETIPVPGEGLWEPLSLDYTKCLASLLRYRPHTEHLDKEDWGVLISFCLAGLSYGENEESQLSIRSGYRSVLEDLDASDSHSTPLRVTAPIPVSRERHNGNRNVIEEVVICIQLLTTSPTPLQATAQSILHGLSDFVESSVAGNAHQLAFNSINAVVTKVMFDQSELVRSVLLGLIPVIRRLWATKLQILKEELLATLMLSMIVLVDTARKEPSESLAFDIEGLASTLHSEYVRRSEKEILQIDETMLYQNEACQNRPVYGPCLGTARSEQNWTVLWLIAELLKLSDGIHNRIKSGSTREGSNKRQRFSSEIRDVFRDSVSATGIRRICALQLIPFLESEIDIETKEPFFKQLVLNVSGGNGAVSSWTMVALTRPSAISDSSLRLWASIARMMTQFDPGSTQQTSIQICGWLREVWAGSVTDRIQTARVAAFARPLELLDLFFSCTNRSFAIPRYQVTGPTGLIGRTWFFQLENRELLDYCFHTNSATMNPWDLRETWSLKQFSRQDPADVVILDLLRVRSESFLHAWHAMNEERSHITPDNLQIMASFCVVVSLFMACLPQSVESQSRSRDLKQNYQNLWNAICEFLAAHAHDSAFVQSCLDLLSPLLGPLTSSDTPPAIMTSIKDLVAPLSKTLEHFRQSSKIPSTDDDPMDLDDRFMAEAPLATDETILALNRNSLSVFLDPVAYQCCVTIQLSIFLRTQADCGLSSVVEYLTGLDEADILATQAILPEVFQLCSKLEPSELLSIIEHFGEKCLQSYEMERCEASHCICIRMMTSFIGSWTNGPDDTLKESAMDLYIWFMEALLARKRATPKVYIALAELIRGVIGTCPSYGKEQSLPSPRTNLFAILRGGDVQVKFSVAKFIPALFERFLLKDHDAIFDDVLESLPRDPEWIEGIAVRLFVLSQLACRWHTLLRRSIYHLFETPAQVPLSLWYAERCMVSVSQTLGLQDAKELFRLFSSQILYTWTETQSIMSMPYSIFGYDSLQSMLVDVKDEIVGQMMMRAKEQETIELAKYLQIPHLELLTTSFHKAESYSIARDISTPPEQGTQPKGVEIRLRKLLGADQFMTQIESQFPLIIATFFRSLDFYDQIGRAFSKRENFGYALEIQAQIINKSTSQNSLPANQQPSFRARYLLHEIDFLCRSTGFELESIWTPSLVSFVCRSLLESIHPALGSLHACSVIRKIRILTYVAGPVILQDYPLEMTLSCLRPFLGDIHCSEDALGIFWYLLEAGKPYLQVTPGFTAGIAVSTLVTLRRIFSSLSENTTQESQLRTVQYNAKKFYQWLVELLRKLSSSDWDAETKTSFDRLVWLAEKFLTSEGSSGGQAGKDLVFEVLKDRDSATSLLSKPVADLVLSLLCPEFEQTSDTENWVSDEDLDPASYVVSLWHTFQNFSGGPLYRLWAARVIGRSFAATGKIDQLLLREQDLSLFQSPETPLSSDIFCHSKAKILRFLCDMLHAQKHFEAGLVERTLQLIVSNIAHYPEFQGCSEVIPESLMKALIWNPYTCPAVVLSNSEQERCENAATSTSGQSVADWARSVSLFLSNAALEDPVIGSLRKVLNVNSGLAVQLLPYVVHDVLLSERGGKGERGDIRGEISAAFRQVLSVADKETLPHAQLVINCILYLRNQPVPDESTIVQRDKWLEIDFGEASLAAHRCGLHKTSLLFLEIQTSRVVMTSRRSSVVKYDPPPALLHDVFKNIDDPDLFYGIQQSSSLASVMERLDYESSGFKNLLFQSAKYDSEIQMSDKAGSNGVLKALNATNLRGIANTMLSASSSANDAPVAFASMLQAATSLQKWDIPVSPLDSSPSATVFRTFQGLNTSGSLLEVTGSIESGLLTTLSSLLQTSGSAIKMRESMRALGIMTEISDTLHFASFDDVEKGWQSIMARSSWLKTESYHEVGEILSCHEALFSSLRKNDVLKSRAKLNLEDSRLLEAKVIRQSLEITRIHGISQVSLKSAMSLSKLAEPCAALGMNIDAAAKFDLANVLWDQGEMTASIRMLQQLKDQNDLHKQAIPLSRAELLVTLGHHVAEARLEKPDSILQEYLYPAVKELRGSSDGEEAGRVYHGFATFCDQQLLNPDVLEDFKRVEQLRDRKEKEVLGLEEMMKNSTGKEREYLKNYRAKAKQWFDLDDREYQRLLRSREAFLQQCLENYLLSLRESDTYNNDALRFCALWLDKADSDTANSAVSRYLNAVPSRKFAPLMNQLSSRLLDVSDDFQKLLTQLVFRICVEHPFHGMYQIFASSKSKGGKDQSSHSRFRAANQLVDRLKNDSHIGQTWIAVHNVNISYVRFAVDKPDSKYKSGAKVPLKNLTTGQRLGQDATTYQLPPPTMKIALRADCDYSRVPTVTKFHPEFTIASGVSAPKIVTAVASNGERYKQLYKGGNDDLRQDAIMEQVFEQVSSLLKDHQPTRQRSLGIRTYKVLPLTPSAGIIEFVPNTIPLHDYLMPAHQKYFPKDMKPNSCRKHIADVQTKSFEQRVRTYRQVTEHFHPVMRYFFMEKFNNPDDWFSKRLAYTRSTAAISILGHVLGLGDRHGHNILLDEKTGEVVHIDLGVAFEQGRVLPVPEVVPFRLTRDLVDGFGITKTEGVFRRCCEFTLEALRQESYSIMTILDVLRYDPLYSWTVSPLRVKKMQMQDNQASDGPPALPGAADALVSKSANENEPSEADRALTVVAKKLSKTLSVTATVNELVQQARDEKNLAMLYCGWASYA
ncbi:PIK-related kinase, FATC [Penicillium digitatum]|uniref:Serine/threonine-protein kinase Tel1 n=1 Tax=Penicillium digitatum TaxID=36651 RepID=A0A7T7BLA1_PENDI|nr:PIK-related kinase, FATC [Penicillium digitatum]